jgi:uncharacterized protein YcbK (DUF882 family)
MFCRKVLYCGTAAIVLLLSGSRIPATGSILPKYQLRLYNLHTGEHLNTTYRVGNQYQSGALAELDHFLRDYRTGVVHEYDTREFELLHDLMVSLGRPNGEIDIVCGYRTGRTNEWLRHHGHAVARRSQHIEGRAIDIRVPGYSAAKVRDAALLLHRGGVGYYAESDFVHVDVGPVRRW